MESFKPENHKNKPTEDNEEQNNLISRRNLIIGGSAVIGGGVLAGKGLEFAQEYLEESKIQEEAWGKYLVNEIDHASFEAISSTFVSTIADTYQQFVKHIKPHLHTPKVVEVMKENTEELNLESISEYVGEYRDSGDFFIEKTREAQNSRVVHPYALLGVLRVFLEEISEAGRDISHAPMSLNPGDMKAWNILPAEDRPAFDAALQSVENLREKLNVVLDSLKKDSEQSLV